MKYIFYIEPDSELFFGKDEVLLYNTLTGDYLVTCLPKEIMFLLKIKRNNFSLVLSDAYLNEHKVFINRIIKLNIGIIDIYNKKKPFRISNEPKLNFEITNSNNIYSMLDYVKEITIHLGNNIGNINYKYFQTTYPFASEYLKTLNINNLKYFLSPLNNNFETLTINIVLPNDIKGIKKELREIIDYFGNKRINIYLNQNIKDAPSINKHNHILIVDDYKKNVYYNNSYICNFLIENENDYESANKIIKKLDLNHYYTPIYNYNNLDFFEENVFIDKNDIFSEIKTIDYITKNKLINNNNFGKIIIRSDGNVFSNQNYKTHGNIEDINLLDVVIDEINNKGAWFNRRQFKSPCKKCIYKYLCPSISNYELLIKRYNLCLLK